MEPTNSKDARPMHNFRRVSWSHYKVHTTRASGKRTLLEHNKLKQAKCFIMGLIAVPESHMFSSTSPSQSNGVIQNVSSPRLTGSGSLSHAGAPRQHWVCTLTCSYALSSCSVERHILNFKSILKSVSFQNTRCLAGKGIDYLPSTIARCSDSVHMLAEISISSLR